MATNLVFKNGFFQTNSRSFDARFLRDGLMHFIQRNKSYKSHFSQKHYSYGFDGYSYLGQEDSSNQYASDLLHSFVISDFVKPTKFPTEFDTFFNKDWEKLQLKIRELEIELIEKLQYPGLKYFYESHIGHMISCNYYPRVEVETDASQRLSEHTDVSLFTIFPFGFDSDFYFEKDPGLWVNIPATNDVIIFPGYLLQLFTQGKIKALNHKVAMPQNRNKERFSFAYFSLPYPKHSFKMAEIECTSEAYFEQYLTLF